MHKTIALLSLTLAACGPTTPMELGTSGTSFADLSTSESPSDLPTVADDADDPPGNPWESLDPDPDHRLVFVTSKVVMGDFGAGSCHTCLSEDFECNRLAALAGLLPVDDDGGLIARFRAFVAYRDLSPDKRITQIDQPYVMVDGTVIAESWTALAAGPLLHPITIDELGEDHGEMVWIGEVGQSCSDWTDASDGSWALRGNSATVDGRWRADSTGLCSQHLALYCFETWPGEAAWPIGENGVPL